MPVAGKRYAFTKTNVDGAPEGKGVYALYDNDKVIYYGKGNIRERLQAHYRGDEGPCTKGATHYKREVTPACDVRERELLKAYFDKHGRLPRCNKVMP